jgi:hypothetical protein
MTKTLDPPKSPTATRAPRKVNGKVPPGCKTLQAIIPDWLYYRIHAQASLNCMDWSDYLYQVLQEQFTLSTPSLHESAGLLPKQDIQS